MSDVYINRLRAVRADLDIASEAFDFILSNWHKRDVADVFRRRSQARVQRAETNLETTYFVRLTAEFEGILKDHLRTNHPEIAFPAQRREWTVDWFLSRVIQRENITLPANLRARLDEVRDYRNALAHGNEPGLAIRFDQALARYNAFLANLPNPRS